MRLLADENMHPRIIRALRHAGHDVMAVSDVARSSPDDEVLDLADGERRVLLTFDKDFGELAFLWGRGSAGIILLRLPKMPLAERSSRLCEALPALESQAPGHFVVVTKDELRIRPLLD
jgi:predicted nuclease of predicted toxin-antitoxin system